MVMLLVVPVEEGPAEAFGVLDAAEPLGELGLIFQGLEAAFREWVVVPAIGQRLMPARVRAAMPPMMPYVFPTPAPALPPAA